MDPDTCLAEALASMHRALADEDSIDSNEAANALHFFSQLNEWLSKGGFLPIRWQRPCGAGRLAYPFDEGENDE